MCGELVSTRGPIKHRYLVDIRGQRFGRLVALEPTERRCKSDRSIVWRFRCDCGRTHLAKSKNVVYGRTRSCGCLRREHVRKLGKAMYEARFGVSDRD